MGHCNINRPSRKSKGHITTVRTLVNNYISIGSLAVKNIPLVYNITNKTSSDTLLTLFFTYKYTLK